MDGVHFASDKTVGQDYTGHGGVYLKCAVNLVRMHVSDSAGKTRFWAWCRSTNVTPDNSSRTTFLLQHGYDSIRSGPVVLMPRYANPSVWKRKRGKIRILSVHRASDASRIRV